MSADHLLPADVRSPAANLTHSTNDRYLRARQVWERYSICQMTLHRWLRYEGFGFPQPLYIGRNRFWKLADLEAWERDRAAGTA